MTDFRTSTRVGETTAVQLCYKSPAVMAVVRASFIQFPFPMTRRKQ